MSISNSSCSHTSEIIDQREGIIVCTECGLVLDFVYINKNENNYNEYDNLTNDVKSYIYEIIERLNLPQLIFSYVIKKIEEKKNKNKICYTFIASCIYNTLYELKIPFSINDICAVTGINSSKIYKEKKDKNENDNNSRIIIIETDDILERACSKLNLKYEYYTLIKESIDKSNNGFNPSTVISAYILIFCRENNIKKTLKEISQVTGVSCMSILRYIKKNALSSRTKISKR